MNDSEPPEILTATKFMELNRNPSPEIAEYLRQCDERVLRRLTDRDRKPRSQRPLREGAKE